MKNLFIEVYISYNCNIFTNYTLDFIYLYIMNILRILLYIQILYKYINM